MDFVSDQFIEASDAFKINAHIKNLNDYHRIYKLSIQDPDTFWLNVAENFYWKNGIKTDNVFMYNLDVNNGPISISFMKGAQTNACYNLVDRIINLGLGNRIAYYW